MIRGIIVIFNKGLKMLRIVKPSPVDLPRLVFKTKDMLLLPLIKLHLGALTNT